jgi:hypothetical protein
VYEQVVAAEAINRDLISRLYQVADGDIPELVAFDPAAAMKITIRRSRTAGDVGETDVYGAQQHAPQLGLELDLPAELSSARPRLSTAFATAMRCAGTVAPAAPGPHRDHRAHRRLLIR